MKNRVSILLTAICICACGQLPEEFSDSYISDIADRVASWQIENFDSLPDQQAESVIKNQLHWSNGVLYAGMFKWAERTDNQEIFAFLKEIGDKNDWNLYSARTIYHADDMCVGQTFVDMAEHYCDSIMMMPALRRAEEIASNPSTAPLSKKDETGKYDRWSWCDALFMAPPAYAHLYTLTGNEAILDYMQAEFRECTDSLYDKEEHLYFRDCIRADMREPNGAKEFWARGNAWVFAGIARTLDNLPWDFDNRKYYEGIFKEMATAVKACLGKDGSWRPSLLDPAHYDSPENSSSALFCYGIAWGINNGLLNRKEYLPVLKKAWKALCSHVHDDGKLGYVQPIGAFPQAGITTDDTQVYAVGGFLMAAAEIMDLIDSRCIGTLALKTSHETHNDISIDCGTQDRGYVDYESNKVYLEPLGLHKVRLQAGWAKTEKQKGVYDFEWLDKVIDDVVSRGLTPWLQTSYGNPIYEGGGTIFLAGGWPVSEEALDAWDRWVRTMAERYKGKVREWEIWNEPDINTALFADVSSFVHFTERTIKILKEVDPDCRIAAFAWALCLPDKFEKCLQMLQDDGYLEQIDWITYHFYEYRPEDMYAKVDIYQNILNRFDTPTILRQGETGAPSRGYMGGALANYGWTEESQSKWTLRRLMTDKARNIPSAVFAFSDITYSKEDHISLKNYKGLLETNEDKTVKRPKRSFSAVRALASVWDNIGKPVDASGISISVKDATSLYAFDNGKSKSIVFWKNARIPMSFCKTIPCEIEAPGFGFKNPVAVDFRTGKVYKVDVDKNVLQKVPIYDSPVMIIEKQELSIR